MVLPDLDNLKKWAGFFKALPIGLRLLVLLGLLTGGGFWLYSQGRKAKIESVEEQVVAPARLRCAPDRHQPMRGMSC